MGVALTFEWYQYINHNHVFVGNGVGVKDCEFEPPESLSDFCFYLMSVDETILHKQCQELTTNYNEMKCPLRPELALRPNEVNYVKAEVRTGKKGKNRG